MLSLDAIENATTSWQVVATDENELARLWPQHLRALEAGVELALGHGPLRGFPVVDARVELHWCQVARGTSLAMVTAAASQCLARALKEADIVLLEPIMHLEAGGSSNPFWFGEILGSSIFNICPSVRGDTVHATAIFVQNTCF